jgi:hypothetical protein
MSLAPFFYYCTEYYPLSVGFSYIRLSQSISRPKSCDVEAGSPFLAFFTSQFGFDTNMYMPCLLLCNICHSLHLINALFHSTLSVVFYLILYKFVLPVIFAWPGRYINKILCSHKIICVIGLCSYNCTKILPVKGRVLARYVWANQYQNLNQVMLINQWLHSIYHKGILLTKKDSRHSL